MDPQLYCENHVPKPPVASATEEKASIHWTFDSIFVLCALPFCLNLCR